MVSEINFKIKKASVLEAFFLLELTVTSRFSK